MQSLKKTRKRKPPKLYLILYRPRLACEILKWMMVARTTLLLSENISLLRFETLHLYKPQDIWNKVFWTNKEVIFGHFCSHELWLPSTPLNTKVFWRPSVSQLKQIMFPSATTDLQQRNRRVATSPVKVQTSTQLKLCLCVYPVNLNN